MIAYLCLQITVIQRRKIFKAKCCPLSGQPEPAVAVHRAHSRAGRSPAPRAIPDFVCWHKHCRAFLLPPCVERGSLELWIYPGCSTLYTGSPFHGSCHILANWYQTMLSCPQSHAFLCHPPNQALISSQFFWWPQWTFMLLFSRLYLLSVWLRWPHEHRFRDELAVMALPINTETPIWTCLESKRGLKELFLKCRLPMNALSLFPFTNNVRHSN